MPQLITTFWVRNEKHRAVKVTYDEYDDECRLIECDLIIEKCEEDAMGQERWVTCKIVKSDLVKSLVLDLASRPTLDQAREILKKFETEACELDHMLLSD